MFHKFRLYRKPGTHVKDGFTLVEMLVYAVLLGMISVALIQVLLYLGTTYHRLQADSDVVASLRSVMETIGRGTQGAVSIYTPTSVFGDPISSQLSLKTPLHPSTNESLSYVDFYVDNGRLYMKQEGIAAIPLTAESVTVTQFSVWRVLAGSRESAEITVQITSNLGGVLKSTSLATASFTPRGNY